MPALWLLLVALVVAGAAIANKLPVPNAVIWCVLGFTVAFIPGFPAVKFDPNIALYLFLPPLVYSSAVELPWPEFRDNLRPIAMLAVGLVVLTTAIVAVVAHFLMGFPWPVATVLGAVLSPTDPVAASAIASRVGMPRRLVAILEGEGLVNDAVSLTIFRIALTATVGGAFSLGNGVERFFAILILEPLYGWLLGIAVARLRARITDARMEIAVSLLTPFAAYLLPEHLGGSGILATVATGMYIGEQRSTLVPAGTRLHATSVWEMIVFLLNGILFLTAGMELRNVIVSSSAGVRVVSWGIAIAATVALVRLGWSAAHKYGMRALRIAFGWERHQTPTRYMAVIAWSGMRGPISLAAALSIPASVSGKPFPDFQLILFTTAVVIVATLVVQGTALGPLVQVLGVSKDAQRDKKELEEQQLFGKEQAARAALEKLFALQTEGLVPPDVAERLGRIYKDRLAEVQAQADSETAGRKQDMAIRAQLLNAERARILQLRKEGRISNHALAALERKLDLSETLLD